MNLESHYAGLWEESYKKFSSGEFELDPLIDAATDTRYGITLRARPDQETRKSFGEFIQELKALDADQYYYPDSDIHITIMSIISCYPGFDTDLIRVSDYSTLISQIVLDIIPFDIQFKGITASPATIMVQGFPADGSLQQLRDKLRTKFKLSGLQQSIDKRYTIQTAHSTIVRFKSIPKHPALFLQKLMTFKDHPFGSSSINSLELVCNDWYHRRVSVLEKFTLN